MDGLTVCVCCAGRGDAEGGEGEGRRTVRHPDSHQLFVGNLPHDIDEGELKEFFMCKCTPCFSETFSS